MDLRQISQMFWHSMASSLHFTISKVLLLQQLGFAGIMVFYLVMLGNLGT